MKVFVGRSQSLWVVDTQKGKVRKLPISLGTLVGATLGSVLAATVCLAVITQTGFNPSAWVDVVKKSVLAVELQQQSEKMHSVIVRLQQEKEEARRLNTRLASRLENIEGALGSVANGTLDESPKSKNSKDKDSLFKPASFNGAALGFDQRRAIKRIDRLVLQLKHLPLKAPVLNPMITSTYGARISPNGIGSSFHHGVDFSLRDSTNVFATGSGIIETVGTMRGYGLYVDIMHRPGVVTRYAHLALASVKEGQRVRTGQLIAQGGSSGTSTGRHLHYEVLINGRSRDPMFFLKLPSKLEFALKSADHPRSVG